jgi:hypothetical protein
MMDAKKAYTFLHEAVNGALKGPGDEMAKRIYATFVTLPKPRDLDMASEERAAWVAQVKLMKKECLESTTDIFLHNVVKVALDRLLDWNANRS